MGSIARMRSIEVFSKIYGEPLEDHFSYLIGKQVEDIENIEADYYVKGNLTVDGEPLPIHYRWTSPEEDHEGVELEEDFMKLEDYFNNYLKDTFIVNVIVGYQERDDEVYLTCKTNNDEMFEIPLGFDPERNEFDGFADTFFNEREKSLFDTIRETTLVLKKWEHLTDYDDEILKGLLKEFILVFYNSDEVPLKPKNNVTAYEKLSTISQIYEGPKIFLETFHSSIKNVLKQ